MILTICQQKGKIIRNEGARFSADKIPRFSKQTLFLLQTAFLKIRGSNCSAMRKNECV